MAHEDEDKKMAEEPTEQIEHAQPHHHAAKEATEQQPAEHTDEKEQIHPKRSMDPKQFFRYFWAHKPITIPVAIIVFLLLLIVPFTPSSILGLFVKQTVTVTVIDSQTKAPISKVRVVIENLSATTNAVGVAHLKVPLGYPKITVSKAYYRTYTRRRLIALDASANHITVALVALGRVVPVSVINKINGKPAADVTVKALSSEAVTASDGTAMLVLPANATSESVTMSGNGFNSLTSTLQVTDQVVAANSFSIMPSGWLYFLSNLSGKIDVVKTNLDGSNRKTVLAGTGFEDQYSTTLLASRDWKYLALYAKRSANGNPEIDLIDTSTDTMSNIDEGNASFTLYGWAGDAFVYQVNRLNVPVWQNGNEVLKSFDATSKKLTILAQTVGSGDSTNYLQQLIGSAYIVNGEVAYTLNWQTGDCYYNTDALLSKQATFNIINTDGSGQKVLKTFSPYGGQTWCSLTASVAPYDEPSSLAIAFPPSDTNTKFYTYENGTVAPASDLNSQNFYSSNYPTFLESPSGNQTFWSVYADGKNNLLVGDQNGQNQKQIATESDYSPYGWYTDNYLLVQKSGSELYIMGKDGTSQPLKISNYYKPNRNYPGYGGGYGGL